VTPSEHRAAFSLQMDDDPNCLVALAAYFPTPAFA